jgi:adenosylcobinamide-GDP ribazoletransferase
VKLARRFVRVLSYFTSLPVPSAPTSPDPEDLALLPLVGAFVGFVSGAGAFAASRAFSPRVGAAFAFGLPIALTGALHLDGFLDICDAAFAPVGLDKRREILKDPRHGSFAFAGGAIVAVLNYAALREIDPQDWPSALTLAEGAARYAALVVARVTPHVDDAGTAARAFAQPSDDRFLVVEGAVLCACAYGYGGTRLATSTVAIMAASIALARIVAGRFGGTLSGDGYGFVITVTQTAMLSACA